MAFLATAPFLPTTTETLTIPSGPDGPRSKTGTTLTAPVTVSFTVAQASTERLQQLLAQLGYLPLSFTPAGPLSSPVEATTAQDGNFAWRWPNQPTSLTSLWTEGSENVITKGALMNFENQNGLTVDGLAGVRVWTALLADVAAGKTDADPYTYVFVVQTAPRGPDAVRERHTDHRQHPRQHRSARRRHDRRHLPGLRTRGQFTDAGDQP